MTLVVITSCCVKGILWQTCMLQCHTAAGNDGQRRIPTAPLLMWVTLCSLRVQQLCKDADNACTHTGQWGWHMVITLDLGQ